MSNIAANFDTQFTHHTAKVNDVRLHYVMGGKGDPVVLLHGWPQTWYEWRHIMPALAERYTVIAPDIRGLGDSSKPATGYDKRTVAEDIYQLVHQIGFKQINLVGHDIGGMVAYAYAAAHPETVGRLVLMELLLPGFGLEQMFSVSRSGEFLHMPFHMAPDIPEALVTGRERMYLSWFYNDKSYNLAAITEEDIDEYVRCYSAPGALRAGFEYYRAFLQDAEHNREYALQKLLMPVLAMGGASSVGDLLQKALPAVAENVRGLVVERCGHWIAEERPDYLTQQLLTFFGEEK